MSKRFMIYLRKISESNGATVYRASNNFNQNMWPDGHMYFNVHKKDVYFHIEIQAEYKILDDIRLDKFRTFNADFMNDILKSTLDRMASRGYRIELSPYLQNGICREAVDILNEIKHM